MARISTYGPDQTLHLKDKVLGSSYIRTVNNVDEFETKNFTLEELKGFLDGELSVSTLALKPNGGLQTEVIDGVSYLAVNLGASDITGQLANSDLANSSITINGTAISLGGTVTTPNTQLTDAQVRSKISVTGGGSYNSSTGVITIPAAFTLATGNVTNASVSGQTLTLTRQNTTNVTFTPTANDFTNTLKTKLDNIESNATADQTAAEIRTLVEAATDSNVFTDNDHTKLNNIEANATADLTASEIKTLYEGNSDTNAFTDADHNKLDGIAAGAEVNVQANWNESTSTSDAFIQNKPTLFVGTDISASTDNDAKGITVTSNAASATIGLDVDGLTELTTADFNDDFLIIWDNNVQTNKKIHPENIIPIATSSRKGGIKIGYTESGKNYPVELDSEKAYVNVPWTDTNTQLSTEQVQDIIGDMVSGNTETNISVTYDDTNGKLDFASTDTNTQLSKETVQDYVGEMLTGNTETNITVTYDDSNNKINFASTDTNTQLTDEQVQDVVGAMVSGNTESNITVTYDDTNGKLDFTSSNTQLSKETVQDYVGEMLSSNTETRISVTYDDANNKINFVADDQSYTLPTASSSTLGGVKVGGNLTIDGNGVLNVGAIALTTVQTAANETAHLALTAQEGDIVVRSDENKSYVKNDGTAGTMADYTELLTPTDGVFSLTTTDGTYINLTPNSPTTGAVTVTADLSAVDGTSDTTDRFLTKDNKWAVPSYTTDTNTFRTVQADGASIGSTETLNLIGGTNVTLSENNGAITIAATDTDTNTFRTVEVDSNGNGSANSTLEATETLRFKKGSNITLSEAAGVITISSADSNTFRPVEVDGSAIGATETLDLVAGNNITLSESNGEVTIDGTNTTNWNWKVDANTATAISAGDTVTVNGGNAISLSTTGANVTINHTDTSSQGSVNNSGRTYIQDITLDTYGHITGITSATETYSYTHPTHPGDDINVDTGALTGATVISDLDFNITTDTKGHVTDANGTVSTRNLTASDIGAAASSHTHAATDITSGTFNVNRYLKPTSGDWWNNGVGIVGTDGVMEVGRYIDFHHSDTTTSDYSVRLDCESANVLNVVGGSLEVGGYTVWDENDFTSTNVSNWNTAYGDKVDSMSFNTGNGVLTLNRQDGGTVTQDLDGRYVLDTGDTVTGTLRITGTSSWLTAEGNVGGTTPPFAQGLALGWNRSNGSRESEILWHPGNTTHADGELYFRSYNGSSYVTVLELKGDGSAKFHGALTVDGCLTTGDDCPVTFENLHVGDSTLNHSNSSRPQAADLNNDDTYDGAQFRFDGGLYIPNRVKDLSSASTSATGPYDASYDIFSHNTFFNGSTSAKYVILPYKRWGRPTGTGNFQSLADLNTNTWVTVSNFNRNDGPGWAHDTKFMPRNYKVKIGSGTISSSDPIILAYDAINNRIKLAGNLVIPTNASLTFHNQTTESVGAPDTVASNQPAYDEIPEGTTVTFSGRFYILGAATDRWANFGRVQEISGDDYVDTQREQADYTNFYDASSTKSASVTLMYVRNKDFDHFNEIGSNQSGDGNAVHGDNVYCWVPIHQSTWNV